MRYWFNVRNGNGLTLDEEGQIALDADAAQKIAVSSIRSIIGEEVTVGRLDLRGAIDVRCEDDNTGFTVEFAAAFDLLLPSEGQ